jgi:hypothetical protein
VEKSLPGGRIGEMRGFLKEHSGAFDPDEVHTLVAAFDKAWEAIQASGVVLSLSETYALKYWWCSPPRTGIASVRPTVWMVRGIGASLCSDRCVRASL